MLEEWTEIEDFPGYSVSTYGEVYNHKHERMLTVSLNSNGIPTVGMYRAGHQYRRSIPVLVATAWIVNDFPGWFDTPIHLNGDRLNCRADNLIWRPRWFAIRYHKEILIPQFPVWPIGPFMLLQTNEVFHNPREAALQYGLREMDIFLAMLNDHDVFPGNFTFRPLR